MASRPDEGLIEALGKMIDSLASARSWVIHPPYFVHQEEEMLDPETGKPIVTVGGCLKCTPRMGLGEMCCRARWM